MEMPRTNGPSVQRPPRRRYHGRSGNLGEPCAKMSDAVWCAPVCGDAPVSELFFDAELVPVTRLIEHCDRAKIRAKVLYVKRGVLTIHTSPEQSATKRQQLASQSLGKDLGVRGLQVRLQEKLFPAPTNSRKSAGSALGTWVQLQAALIRRKPENSPIFEGNYYYYEIEKSALVLWP